MLFRSGLLGVVGGPNGLIQADLGGRRDQIVDLLGLVGEHRQAARQKQGRQLGRSLPAGGVLDTVGVVNFAGVCPSPFRGFPLWSMPLLSLALPLSPYQVLFRTL